MHRTLLAALVGVALAVAGCGSRAGPEVLSIHIGLAGDTCGVVTADVTVSAPDMGTLGPIPLTVSSTAITGQVDNVPAGPARLVTVNARNQYGQIAYQGSVQVNVVAGQTASANILLVRDPTVCSGTGSIGVTGTIGNTPPLPDGGDVLGGAAFAFTFSDADLSSNGVIAFFDAATDRVRRLDLASRQLLPELVGSADAVSFALVPDGSLAYVGYAGGRMDVFDLDAGTGKFFAAAPATVSSMLVADAYLFTVDDSGAWDTHSLFQRSTGARVDAQEWRETIRSMAYAPLSRKVFYLDAFVSPTDVHMETIDATGKLVGDTDSPYHGSYDLPNPLRLLPDQSGVIIGSGLIFNTSDLTYRTSIGLSFTDVAFLGSRLYLIDPVGPNTQLRVLDSGFNILSAKYFPGTPRRAFAWNGKIVLVLENGGGLNIWFLDP